MGGTANGGAGPGAPWSTNLPTSLPWTADRPLDVGPPGGGSRRLPQLAVPRTSHVARRGTSGVGMREGESQRVARGRLPLHDQETGRGLPTLVYRRTPVRVPLRVRLLPPFSPFSPPEALTSGRRAGLSSCPALPPLILPPRTRNRQEESTAPTS